MNFLWAFIIGGAFCAVAQVLIDKTKLTPARILVLYVTLGVFRLYHLGDGDKPRCRNNGKHETSTPADEYGR